MNIFLKRSYKDEKLLVVRILRVMPCNVKHFVPTSRSTWFTLLLSQNGKWATVKVCLKHCFSLQEENTSPYLFQELHFEYQWVLFHVDYRFEWNIWFIKWWMKVRLTYRLPTVRDFAPVYTFGCLNFPFLVVLHNINLFIMRFWLFMTKIYSAESTQRKQNQC